MLHEVNLAVHSCSSDEDLIGVLGTLTSQTAARRCLPPAASVTLLCSSDASDASAPGGTQDVMITSLCPLTYNIYTTSASRVVSAPRKHAKLPSDTNARWCRFLRCITVAPLGFRLEAGVRSDQPSACASYLILDFKVSEAKRHLPMTTVDSDTGCFHVVPCHRVGWWM